MNRFVSKTLATGMACAGLMAMLVSWPVAAEDDAVIAADKVVVAALAKADKVSADKWLEPDFTWIDSEGIMWAKTDAFRAELKPLLVLSGHDRHSQPAGPEIGREDCSVTSNDGGANRSRFPERLCPQWSGGSDRPLPAFRNCARQVGCLQREVFLSDLRFSVRGLISRNASYF
jgi:hypothetical protein